MPLGFRHEEIGLIVRHEAGLALRRDDGGLWRLSGPDCLRAQLGRRVRLVGTRIAFDELEVELVNGSPLSRAGSLAGFLTGAVLTLAALAVAAMAAFGF